MLYDDEFRKLGKHIAGGAGFLSNLILWRESGYFDVAAETKPLLHLWSLGIEEQFYIFWPLIVWLGWKQKVGFFALTALVLLASFLLNVVNVSSHPVGVFYLPFTRFWELLCGASLAWLISHRKEFIDSISKQYGDFLSYFGVGLLLLAFLSVTRNSQFPGWWAALPVIGAMLIIASGSGSKFNRTVLSSPVLVWIGLISYPLYLWHWPLLSFALIIEDHVPAPGIRGAVVVASIVLAWLTFRLVEAPVRRNSGGSRSVAFLAIAMGCLALFGIGTFFGNLEALSNNLGERLGRVGNTSTTANIAPARVMLLGDSHASHLFHGLNRELEGDIANYASDGCIPFFDVDRYDSRFEPGACAASMKKALEVFVGNPGMETIILASMGPVYLTGEGFKGIDTARIAGLNVVLESNRAITDRWLVYEIGMKDTLSRLTASGKSVVFVIDVPELGINPRLCKDSRKEVVLFGRPYTIRGGAGQCVIARDDYDRRTERYRNMVLDVAKDYPSVVVFDPTPLFCDQVQCNGVREGRVLYKDSDHLSVEGSEYVARHLAPLIQDSRRAVQRETRKTARAAAIDDKL